MTATFTSVPAPWKLHGKSWVFAVPGLSDKASFPAGWAAPSQTEALAAGGTYVGGPGSIQIISYADSPAGPYDELIYSPGTWQYPDGSKGFRITRIYVSTEISTFNGRRNWNIPKEVAKFDYTLDSQTNIWTLALRRPSSDVPFFKATFHNIPILSSIPIPFSTRVLGSAALVQPPLVQGPEAAEVASADNGVYCKLSPGMNGTTYLGLLKPALASEDSTLRFGDGKDFPDVRPWSLGIYAPHFNLEFPVPSWTKM